MDGASAMSAVLAVSPARPGASRTPDVTLQVLRTLDEVQALSPAWKDLLSGSPSRNLFLTPVWNRAWWRAFGAGKSLRVLAMHCGDRLVGLAVYMLHATTLRGLPVRVLGTFSNPHVSRTDVLTAAGFEQQVAQRLCGYLADSSAEWDIALLQQLPPDAPWLTHFLRAAPERGLLVLDPVPGIGKCRMPLTQRWDAYVAGRGGHFRRNIGKMMRRVERGGAVVYRHSVDPGPESGDFRVFAELERRSWKDDPEGGAHLGPAGWAFQQEFATAYDEGVSCDNWIVELDGRAACIVHTVGYERVNYCFQTLYDETVRELSLGRAAITRHFESVFDEGRYDALDFNGNSAFCKSWCETETPFTSLQIHHRRPYSRLLWGLKRLRGRQT
jgi:CelD/BcsL family acetyltransferase involved in cellulose biosynthesis